MAVDLGTIVATLAAEVGPFEEGFRAAEARLGAFADMAGGIGSLLTTTVSLPLAAVGTIALESASTYEEAMSTIERRTGASGDALASLGNQFETVFAKSNQSAEDLAAGEATLAARTGETGDALGGLLGKLDALADISGGKVAPLTTEAVDLFKRWGIASADQGHALDTVSRAAQLSGISVSSLLDAVAGGAPFLKAMNLDFVSSTSLLGSLGKAGVDTGQFVVGLRHALTQMAHEGITDASDAFRTLIDRIKDANTPLEAIDIAARAFGPRVGVQLADAIRSGAFSLSQFKTELLTTTVPIEQITEHSKTLGERWTETWHQFQVAVTPVGIAISEVVKGSLIPAVQSVIEKLASFGAAFNNLSPETKTRIVEIGAAFIALGPAIVLAHTAFGLLVTPIATLVGALGALIPSWSAISAAFAIFGGTVLPLVLGLAAVAAAIVGVGTVTELLTHNWSVWWAGIRLTFLQANLLITQGIANLLGSLRDMFAALPGGAVLAKPFADAANLVGDATGQIINRIHELRPIAAESTMSMSEAMTKFGTDTKTAVSDVAGALGTKIAEGAAAAANAVGTSVTTIKGELASLGTAAQSAAAAVAGGVSESSSPALKTAIGTLETLQQKWDKVHESAAGGGAPGMGTFQKEGGPLPSSLAGAIASGQLSIGGQITSSPTSMDISGLGEGVPSIPMNFTPTLKTDTGSAPLSSEYFHSMDDAVRDAMGDDHPLPFITYASGSPTMPFTDYFNSYAPSVMKNFTAGIPGLDFTSNFSDLSAGVRTHLSAGIALGAQGLGADPAQLSNMIASLQDYVATWRGVDKQLNEFGRQDPFGLMAGVRPQDTSAGQLASAGRLLAMLQALLVQIQGMNSTQARHTDAAERTAAGVADLSGDIQSLGSSFTSGRFVQGITKGVQRVGRSNVGNPSFTVGR